MTAARRGRCSAALAFAALALTGTAAAQPVSTSIKLDHFGYRPGDEKVAVFTANPGATVSVRNESNVVVFTVPGSGGSITAKGQDGFGSFDNVWWVDFSPFATPGTYHLHSVALNARSYDFVIGGAVHEPALRAAVKTFYRQRCGTPKPAVHAGVWEDIAACHVSDTATRPAPGHADRGTLDLSGGWHDAGDYNKYVWRDAASAVLTLLRAYEEHPGAFGDDLGIPESGNGVPDLIDELRWELDWMMKMQLPDGSVLSRMHNGTFAWSAPPSTDGSQRFYQDPDAESAAVFAGSAALASRVFGRAGQWAYAHTLRQAALRTWSWLEGQPRDGLKAWAAAEVFRLDPTVDSARAAVDAHHPDWGVVFLDVAAWDTQAALAYVQAPGATPAVVARMRVGIGAQVNYIFDSDDLYRNGMPEWAYFWGSNAQRAAYGSFLLLAARLGATGSRTAAACRAHAQDYLRFFHGQNALSMLYLSNMAALGGEHSSWQIYHGWFGDSWSAYSRANHIGKPPGVVEPHYPYFAGVDNHGVDDADVSAVGPAPGFVAGGPNKNYGGNSTPPLGAVGYNRFYRDWCEQRLGIPNSWEITENSIEYQGHYVALGAPFSAGLRRASLVVDATASASADGNGVFEPGEAVAVTTGWRNDMPRAVSFTGAITSFTGPAGGTYAINDGAAGYGVAAPGQAVTCAATGNCYVLAASGARPGVHWDASARETASTGDASSWRVHLGDSFGDVPRAHPFYRFVETLLHAGVTSGCTEASYCPGGTTTRAQMAVFLLRGREGGAYVAPPATGVFDDVPTTHPFAGYIEELRRRGITSGCSETPLRYCPDAPVLRSQMAFFLLRALEGRAYVPPPAIGVFEDVPASDFFAPYIEELARRGITSGCSAAPPRYCPGDPVTRSQMAVFLVRTFSLALYGA